MPTPHLFKTLEINSLFDGDVVLVRSFVLIGKETLMMTVKLNFVVLATLLSWILKLPNPKCFIMMFQLI